MFAFFRLKPADPEAPPPYTETATGAPPSNPSGRSSIRFDASFLHCKEGKLKVAEIVLSIIGFICVQCASVFSWHPSANWFSTVSMFSIWVTGIMLSCYLFRLIPYINFELFYCGILALCFLIASCVIVPRDDTAFTVAGIFGFLATALYSFDAYLKYAVIKAAQRAEDQKQNNQRPTAIANPAY